MERILVVDDDKHIARLVRSYLEKAGYSVFVAYDGESALHVLRREKPDLVVLDLMLPDRDGWDITRLIRSDEHLAATPIIILTARVEDTDKIVGLEIGADDYITKPFNPREVVARVRALLRRSQLDRGTTTPQTFQVDDLKLDLGSREFQVNEEFVELTLSEFEILHVLMESPGFVFTRDELMDKALGYAFEGMGRTLDSHIKNLRRKIEPDPKKPTYIQTIYGVGYRIGGKRT
ncbi:MAG: response regulator transcription factor [Anaerolineales bacterium]|nr:response regulator transcription factor [Chloroflexota bacterium]MBL6980189.1 response regulator transcription factor [Anaerolineales bacterium]